MLANNCTWPMHQTVWFGSGMPCPCCKEIDPPQPDYAVPDLDIYPVDAIDITREVCALVVFLLGLIMLVAMFSPRGD